MTTQAAAAYPAMRTRMRRPKPVGQTAEVEMPDISLEVAGRALADFAREHGVELTRFA